MRDKSLDIISGIMIIWLVMYHIFSGAGLTDHQIYKVSLQWLFFFIPWFYFKSGMFQQNNAELSMINYTIKNVKSLIFPLIIWTFIGYLISLPEMLIFASNPIWAIIILPFYAILRTGDTIGNLPLWFLFSLFIVKSCGYFLVRLNKAITAIFLLISVLSGMLLYKNKILLPLGIHNVVLGIIFYYFGYLYKKEYSKIKLNNFKLGILVFFFTVLNLFLNSYVDIHLNVLWYGSYIGYILLSVFAIILSIRLFESRNIKTLAWVGRRSMYFLVLHWPILTLIRTIYRIYGLTPSGFDYFFVLISTTFPILFVISIIIPNNILNIRMLYYVTNHFTRTR